MTPSITQFAVYLILAVGYCSLQHTRTNEDFIVGGRHLGPVASAISAGASDMSGRPLLGLPGAVTSTADSQLPILTSAQPACCTSRSGASTFKNCCPDSLWRSSPSCWSAW